MLIKPEYRGMFKKLKWTRLGQVLLLDATTNHFERNLLPAANKYEVDVTERTKNWLINLATVEDTLTFFVISEAIFRRMKSTNR